MRASRAGGKKLTSPGGRGPARGNAVRSRSTLTQRVKAALDALLLAPAFLPLLYVRGFFYPYVAPKTFALRLLGILLLATLVHLVLVRQEFRFERLKQKLAWIPAALLAVAYLASVLGIDFYRSFWSTFERGDGLLTFTVAVLFFYAILLHADARFLRKLAAISMWVGGAVAICALIEWTKSHGRVGATFGSGPFLASYLGLTLFLSLGYARESRGKWTALAYVTAGMQFFAIVLSQTRGTIVALGVAGILAAAYAAWKERSRLRLVSHAPLAVILLLAGGFFVFRTQLALVPFAPLQRIATMSPSEVTAANRLFAWQGIGREALRHPLSGVGAEHVGIVFNAVYDPDRVTDEWLDRSHNAYLDYFVQYGILGALLYLTLIIGALHAARGVLRSGGSYGGCLVLLFVTYSVQNFFVFDTQLTLWLFLAVLASVLALPESVPRPAFSRSLYFAIPAVMSLLTLLLVVPIVITPARANMLFLRADSHAISDIGRSVSDLSKGYALNTYGDLDYGYNTHQMYAHAQVNLLDGEPRFLAYQSTLDILKRNYARYPYDARTAMYLADIIYLTPATAARDDKLMNEAIDRTIQLSPRRALPWYIRANVEIAAASRAKSQADSDAHYREAVRILQEYSEVQPSSAESRYFIASLFWKMQDRTQAAIWAEAGDEVYRPGADSSRRAALYYLTTSQWAKAAEFLEHVVVFSPMDYPVHLELAKAKFLGGDKAGAQAVVARLRAVSPQTLESDPAFMAALEMQ